MKNLLVIIGVSISLFSYSEIPIKSILKKASKPRKEDSTLVLSIGAIELEFKVFSFADYRILKPVDQSGFSGFLVETDSSYFYFDLYKQDYRSLEVNVQSICLMDLNFGLKEAYFFNNGIFTGKSDFVFEGKTVRESHKAVGAPAQVLLRELNLDKICSETNYYKDGHLLYFYPYRTTYEKEIPLGVNSESSFWHTYYGR